MSKRKSKEPEPKPKGIDTSKFKPNEVKELRQQFIDNEIGSDEYHAWPDKGFGFITDALALTRISGTDVPSPGIPLLNSFNPNEMRHIERKLPRKTDPYNKLLAAAHKWLTAYINAPEQWYPATDEAEELCKVIFDIYWSKGQHPYGYETNEELRDLFDL